MGRRERTMTLLWSNSWAAGFGKVVLLLSMIVIGIVILHDVYSSQTNSHLPTFDKPILKGIFGHEKAHGESGVVPDVGIDEDEIELEEVEHDPYAAPEDRCRTLPGAKNVLVILKTGATAIYDRVPIHFETTFKCTPNFLIVSDLDQQVGGVQVHDVIATVRNETRRTQEDFKLYNDIQKYYQSGQDTGLLSSSLGWNLDKWKFLPMIHKAWKEASKEIEWFVMIEGDTSLSWLNLLLWLQTMDPTQELYLGSPAMLVADMSVFNHGGSGVVMSRAAIEKLETTRENWEGGVEEYDAKWEEQTAGICCGDAVLAHAFLDVGIEVTRATPMIQGDTPLTIEWSDDKWCAPAITWHHVNAGEVDSMWQFQAEWAEEHGWEEPYLYRDVFERFVEPYIKVNRTLWDNLSDTHVLDLEDENAAASYDELELAAAREMDGCAALCKRRPECVQWKWTQGKCFRDKRIRFGEAIVPDDQNKPQYTSGWLKDQIAKFKQAQVGCEVKWSS